MGKKQSKFKGMLKTFNARMFLTLCITILCVIIFLIVLNNFALEKFYLYSKTKTLKNVFDNLNSYYNGENHEIDIEKELEEIAIKNNFDILIKDKDNINIYSTNKNFYSVLRESSSKEEKSNKEKVLENNEKYKVIKQKDLKNGLNYVMLLGKLDNGYYLFVRVPITSIQDSVRISNKFLILIAGFTIFISAILVYIISKKVSEPITELNKIANNVANLDFSKKYIETDADDEINNLGRSINIMSDKLEKTITKLKKTNNELEKDIERKSKIDEMRKSFISDVSHELKTPIALIQGYSEGLIENVNSDEESRKFYAEVILDETNKMDRLVKQLLELMKLEYGKREFNNKKFDIVELEKEVIRRSKLLLDEKNVKLVFDDSEKINVYADDFFIEQVITNYLTNSIKNVKEIDSVCEIVVENKVDKKNGIVRVSVYNSGDNIPSEDLERIWKRFYKADKSRNRADGGSGIGLAFVKAIMNNYNSNYGVINRKNGVEFYFEIKLK